MQKIRLKDVAARAGVAVNTASTILNRRSNSWASKETEERVFKAAADLGYKPNRAAQALRFGRFSALALVIPDLQNPYYTAFAEAMEATAEEQGYDVIVETWRNDLEREERILEKLENRNVDGVVAFLSDPEAHRDHLTAQSGIGTPYVVMCASTDTPPPVDAVMADFTTGLREAVDALVELGHRRFAFLSALAEGQESGDRPDSFRQLLADRGINEYRVVRCDHSISGARDAAKPLLALPAAERPTAIIAMNDLAAVATMRAATECGLQVPRDLSVVGVDDIPLGSYLPVSLSTIAQPIASMAHRAVSLLIGQVESKGARETGLERIVFPTSLIRRESIGPAPATVI